MRKHNFCLRRFIAARILPVLTVVATVAPLSTPVLAQSYDYPRNASASRPMSEAEREAEDQVAFSAETIIEVLRNEPGLMLEVKKMVVRKAFEQGRILQPTDLTDDALFQMLREQQAVRILATQQIEARSYIRAKPTPEEVARQNAQAAQYGMQPGNSPGNLAPYSQGMSRSVQPMSQEDAYWATHDNGLGGYGVPTQPRNPSPQLTPPEQLPQQLPNNNPEQQLNRASLDQSQQNSSQSSSQPIQFPPQTGNSNQSASFMNTSAATPYSGPNPQGLGSPALGAGSGTQSAGLRDPSLGFSIMPDFGNSSQSNGDFQSNRQSSPSGREPYPMRRSAADLNEDRPLISTQPNPYADVPSLYDLYQQVAQRPAVLEQFGTQIFRTGTGNTDNLPMDMPVGPDYVLGPGDGLNIELWGAVSQRLKSVVDRQGQLVLPEVGTIQVSGRTLGDVQHLVQSVLRTQFRDVEADVSLARIRSVRVYVVGDVERPGAYDISSLSTPLNGLYYAGGPTARGSLRHIRHFRGDKLIQEVDAYDLLLHGVHKPMARIESGDTLLVPPVGGEVTVKGMVRRPGIYELAEEKSLADVLQLAGGVLPSGTLRHVDVERVVAHENRTMLRLDLPETNDAQGVNQALQQFQVQDGDQINISPILPYAEKTVYLDGHVFHPGKYPYREGMKITDLIRSYSDLLPEPSQRHAEIIRLEAPDFRPVVMAFNLGDAMTGKAADIALKPFDTVRIFGRYDFEDQPQVTVIGAIRDPGDHITNGAIHLRDAIYLAGGTTADADLRDAQVYRKTSDGNFEVLSVNLTKALSGRFCAEYSAPSQRPRADSAQSAEDRPCLGTD